MLSESKTILLTTICLQVYQLLLPQGYWYQERMEALVYHSEPLICEEHVKSHGTIEHCIEIKASSSCLQLNLNDPEIDENFNSNKLLERAVMQFGYVIRLLCLQSCLFVFNWPQCRVIFRCQHYRRRCRIQAPCCNEVFDCRDCHNEAQVRPPVFVVYFMKE